MLKSIFITISTCLVVLFTLLQNAQSEGGGCEFNGGCGPITPPWQFPVDYKPADFVEPIQGMADSSSDSFNMRELVGTSINGMLEESCGGYCIVGFCAHLKLGFSLSKGAYYYTIISPRLEHALPDLIITSYDETGSEPLKEWRQTFGRVIGTANKSIGSLSGSPDGLQGGRSDPLEQGVHQTVSFKEVDIVGHPLAMLPGLVNEGKPPKLKKYKIPSYPKVTTFSPTKQSASTKKTLKETGIDFNPKDLKVPTLSDATSAVKSKMKKAIKSIELAGQLAAIKESAQTVKNIKEIINTALDITEATVRGSVYGNFISPRFRAPRLFCSTDVKPFQPYYLTFADAFWWRSGYPLTDGPISGTDHSKTIINPLSTDTLQKTSSVKEVLTKEVWGNLYPRDGSINQSHDAKTASVLAWRAMDALQTAVKSGHRVGVPLPKSGTSRKRDRWQMIYPQVKACQATPYYAQGSDLTIDSLLPSSKGGYAWNYYRTYDCCSNTSGKKIGEAELPKICLPLSNVLAGIDEDRAAYEQYLEDLKNQGGGDK